jgi:hypothetical protein
MAAQDVARKKLFNILGKKTKLISCLQEIIMSYIPTKLNELLNQKKNMRDDWAHKTIKKKILSMVVKNRCIYYDDDEVILYRAQLRDTLLLLNSKLTDQYCRRSEFHIFILELIAFVENEEHQEENECIKGCCCKKCGKYRLDYGYNDEDVVYYQQMCIYNSRCIDVHHLNCIRDN